MRKETDAVLMTLYRNYLESIDCGVSIIDAKQVGGSDEVSEKFFLDDNPENILDYMNELVRNDYLKAFYASNIIYTSWLTDSGIEYCQKSFDRKIGKFVGFAKTIKDIIPFL